MLFFRNKKSKEPVDYSFIGVDMHSHLLPGIDDGSPDLSTSLDLIRGMQSLGYSKLITTPHILSGMYPNTREGILAKLDELKQVMGEAGISIELHAAAEYYLDDHVAALLKQNEPLLTIQENWVLCEFSLAFPSHGLKEIMFELQMQGYQPVIAHPERYIYLQQSKDFYDELKATGCLFQLNILALAGHYGKSVQELAQYLIRKGYYDLLGTDLHHFRHLEALNDEGLIAQLRKLMDTGKIRNGEMG
jgi:tyrosine-protein phosphatase YwqE